jgi:hypothetical protein
MTWDEAGIPRLARATLDVMRERRVGRERAIAPDAEGPA